MDNLLKEKEKLRQKIDIKNAENIQKTANMNKLKKQLDTINVKIQYETSKIEELDDVLAEKQQLIKELEREVFKYENIHKEKKKIQFEEEYKYYINKTNNLKFQVKDDYKKDFDRLNKIRERCKKFKNLNAKLDGLYDSKQKEVITHAINRVRKYENDVQKIDKLSKSIASIVEMEQYFLQDVFVNFVYDNITYGFSYNFLSARKTNRIDKPEWFVDFLIEKLKTEKRKIMIYQNLKEDDKFYCKLHDKLVTIINKKVDEIEKVDSDQKRELLLHFVEEVGRLITEFQKLFLYRISFEYVKSILLQKEHEYIKCRTKEIHLGDHEKWFEKYQQLINDSFMTCKPLQSFDKKVLPEIISYIINGVVIFIKLLTKRMQFITKEETYIMCHIFSEIEELKFYIQSKQNEISVNNDINVDIDLHPLSKLNNENLKIVKSTTKEDLEFYLKGLTDFRYIQEKRLVNTKLDITNLLKMIQKNMQRGYHIIDKFLGEYIDNFFLDNTILKVRFDIIEFKRFKEFYTQIKDRFLYYNQWKTDTGVKCVEDVLNGKEPIDKSLDSIFNLVYNLYEDEYY